ncbi:MAG: hypothetical protein V4651_07550 [Bacteroidota bacterium]
MQKKIYIVIILWIIGILPVIAQSSSSAVCSTAVGVCSSSSYSFPAGVNAGSAPSGPNYGCLTTQPNPAWFFLQMENNGSMTFTMNSSPSRDIDYVIWGPFTNPFTPCSSGLDTTKIVSCSYSTASTEIGTIPNGVTGEYYILLITNFSNRSTNISFTQTSGSGSSNCDILCNVTGLTATPSACGSGATLGTYSVTGTVTTFTPPISGTLTISSSSGASVTYNAPFNTSLSYTLPNAGGVGDTCIITATFSKVNTCSRSVSIVAPTCCSVSTSSPSALCVGKTLTLNASGTSGGTYYWSGPSDFSSILQSPTIPNIALANAGAYSVYLTYGGCTTNSKLVNVTVNPKPAAKNIVHQ